MMKHMLLLLALATTIVGSGAAMAQSGEVLSNGIGAGYDLAWWTVDGGGGSLNGGGYTLMGTTGQPDAGPALTGGGYTLTGGFWSGRWASGPAGHLTHFPLVSKRH